MKFLLSFFIVALFVGCSTTNKLNKNENSSRDIASDENTISATELSEVVRKFAIIESDRENTTYRVGKMPIKVFASERNDFEQDAISPAALQFCRLMGHSSLGKSYIYSYNVTSSEVGEPVVDLNNGPDDIKTFKSKTTKDLTIGNGLENLFKRHRIQGWRDSGATYVFDYITCK